MISQFFVISGRGDTIISRDYKGDVPRESSETFFRAVKFWTGDPPPVFLLDGVSYLFVKANGIYLVLTTRCNVSPALMLEFLTRLATVFRDYCGVLSEESVRKNFTLIYELLDEMVDGGYPQSTSTELLKAYVFSEPVAVDAVGTSGLRLPRLGNSRTTPSTAVQKPINMGGRASRSKKNEIFVDLIEKISVTFNHNGYITNSEIDGFVQLKSYLSGNPELRLALNQDLTVGKGHHPGGSGVVLDDCNFHSCVNQDEFYVDRVLTFIPPDGEFVLMNYRVTNEFRVPFRIFPFIEESSPYKIELTVKVRADMDLNRFATNVVVSFPVPKCTSGVSFDLASGAQGQSTDYSPTSRTVSWTIKKIIGGSEHGVRAKIVLANPITPTIKRELGPISMTFEIPMHTCSNMEVRFLRIMESAKSYNPYRWVRYVTHANSYIYRLG